MNIAVILAGGVGSRFGAKIPKQFVEVLGKPVIAYTIEAFDKHPLIDAVLVICVKPYMNYVWELKDKYGFRKICWVTEGGDTFQGSVQNGVRFLEGLVDREDILLFHFAASPFITEDIITDAVRVCKEKGNAISTIDYLLLSGKKKTTDSVAESGNYTEEYINRDTIAVMNSPHAFQYGFICDLYREANASGIINTVEPHTTTLMYAMGKKIYFSCGSQSNIKLTRKEDLELFEGYILERQRKTREMLTGDAVVFLADGFEECEGLLAVDLLRRAGLKTVMASVMGRRDVRSSREILVMADCLAEDFDYSSARLIVLPGGRLGTENLKSSDIVKEQCVAFAQDRTVAAVCAAPTILAELGLVKRATVHPDFKGVMGQVEVLDESVVVDGNIITGQGLGATIPFVLEIIGALLGEARKEQIKNAICYRE